MHILEECNQSDDVEDVCPAQSHGKAYNRLTCLASTQAVIVPSMCMSRYTTVITPADCHLSEVETYRVAALLKYSASLSRLSFSVGYSFLSTSQRRFQYRINGVASPS